MTTVCDVAEYILSKTGPTTAMKLQKLVYYSQAWHLAWLEKPLFNEKIEAWRGGPVVPVLFELHKGQFMLQPGFFKEMRKPMLIDDLGADDRDIVDRVIGFYGKHDPHWLSQLTHLEDPWKNARAKGGSEDQERSSEEITHQSMFEYYSSL
ncbi:MAG TPA: type II toxin-antitoxin system antitoxin SocA domain-containing protein [Chlamydiales bacterium]|nr:type II toxin-antitoxin system antitoxin SocA domain-containing protein [Chlamydiales bacterium]